MKKLTLSLIVLLSLAACAEEPTPVVMSTPTLPPRINLDVQSVGLIDHTSTAVTGITPTATSYKPSINEAVRQWAVERLSAVGHEGQAIVTVKDASIRLEAIPTQNDFTMIFKRQQASKYVAHVEVEVSAKRGNDFATATAEASRWVSLPENPTDAERKEAYYSLLNSLMRDLGINLEQNMQGHMQTFVSQGQ